MNDNKKYTQKIAEAYGNCTKLNDDQIKFLSEEFENHDPRTYNFEYLLKTDIFSNNDIESLIEIQRLGFLLKEQENNRYGKQ